MTYYCIWNSLNVKLDNNFEKELSYFSVGVFLAGTILSGMSVLCCGRPRVESKDDQIPMTVCLNVLVGEPNPISDSLNINHPLPETACGTNKLNIYIYIHKY